MHTYIFQTSSLLRFPLPQPCIRLSCPPTCCMSLSSHSSWFFAKWHPGSAHHEGAHCAVSSPPLLPWPSQDLVSSSAPCSQKSSAYASVSLTKFHTQIKQNSSVYFNVCILDKQKSFWTEWLQAFPKFNLLLIRDFCSQLFELCCTFKGFVI